MSSLLDIAPVIPVAVLDDPGRAVDVAHALVDGGIGIIEVTLRTDAALECVRRIATEVPAITLGAGTVLTPHQVAACAEAGARFLVTPGTTDTLLKACADSGIAMLPGAATVSEMLRLSERGYRELKFFPAAVAGGPAFLSAVGGPLPELRFCPTGGVSASNAADYLRLRNVGCVGGSWLTPPDADPARIAVLAKEAAELRA